MITSFWRRTFFTLALLFALDSMHTTDGYKWYAYPAAFCLMCAMQPIE